MLISSSDIVKKYALVSLFRDQRSCSSLYSFLLPSVSYVSVNKVKLPRILHAQRSHQTYLCRVWICLRKNSGNWRWCEKEGQLPDYTSWDYGYPKNGAGKRAYIGSEKVFQWRNQQWGHKALALCERRLTGKSRRCCEIGRKLEMLH